MPSVSASHNILTPTQPVESVRPQRESNPGPPHQKSRALPTGLPPPPPPPPPPQAICNFTNINNFTVLVPVVFQGIENKVDVMSFFMSYFCTSGGRGSSVGRARDSWSAGPGFDPRCGRPLPTGWVGVSIM